MSFPSVNPTTTEAWRKLKHHFEEIKHEHMVDLFAENLDRKKQFSVTLEDVQLDYSKNRITQQTKDLLFQLAEECKLQEAIEAQFSGEKINKTEDRAVLHTKLRDFGEMKYSVKKVLRKMKRFSNHIIKGKWTGFSGKKITDVVNIGIGGSDLGPKMVTNALSFYKNHLNIHYISNVDGDHVQEILKKIKPETTVFIIVSKSFTTQETMANANTIRQWFLQKATQLDIERHFVAVTANKKEAEGFGIYSENIFPMWDWVGGRFSLWSAVGLSTCCAIGYKNFESLLQGAYKMDTHFKNAPFSENIPVLMALLSIWYTNFFDFETEAVIPYSQYLHYFVDYLQQASMESNGKSTDRNENPVTYQTGTIVWGSTGTNAQHAFMQLLHQGTKIAPVDFIGFNQPLFDNKLHHNLLMANFYAQSTALMKGTYKTDVANKYNFFAGNKPSNTILFKQLAPYTLGMLIAMYEHKIFVQGVIWNIFSYDQWGVELGKKMATTILRK